MPLIVAGDGLPQGRVVDTPASLVDIYPFIIECVGEAGRGMVEPSTRGFRLPDLAAGEQPDRTVLSEYHGMGSTTGAFAIRHGRYKYVHYVKYPPQLFDLESDPEETNDLTGDPSHQEARTDCENKFAEIAVTLKQSTLAPKSGKPSSWSGLAAEKRSSRVAILVSPRPPASVPSSSSAARCRKVANSDRLDPWNTVSPTSPRPLRPRKKARR